MTPSANAARNSHWSPRILGAINAIAGVALAVVSADGVTDIALVGALDRAFSVAPAPLNMMELNRLGALNRKNEPIANSLRRELGLPPI